ncbi:hypothetical protein AB4Y30_11355 [Ornithinibacillus sp. 4-3]|uniref:Uncharacterized protein n=1 Tax=Ornithinibacillus sp. 4-3 TaxID=3231488 RepID=A0AB39HIA9_9BACI
MGVGAGLSIFLYIVGLFILYVVIETAVRRGIDSSETSRMLKKMLEEQMDKEKKYRIIRTLNLFV